MREKLYRFMMGRYGNDQLNRFLMVLTLIFFAFSIFGMGLFYLLGLSCLLWAYFRMLSKNTYKRSLENNRYLKVEYKVRQSLSSFKSNIQQRKVYHIYKCPSCRQKIRIPRGKGKIEIKCPKCSRTFIKKS